MMRPILLQVRRYGDHREVIQALSQGLSLLLADSDHRISPAVDPNLLTQGIGARQQVVNYVSADHCHASRTVHVVFGQHAAGAEDQVEAVGHRRGHTAYQGVAARLFRILDMTTVIPYERPYEFTVPTSLCDCLIVLDS